MTQAKKHRFVHPDPEKTTPKPSKKKKVVNSGVNSEYANIFSDLRGSVITILSFTLALAAFYYLESTYQLLDKIKDILI